MRPPETNEGRASPSRCYSKVSVRLFLSQATLEEWAQADKADVQERHLVLHGTPGRLPVEEAVHLAQLVTGPDEAKLLHKVKTPSQLDELSAEQLADSVLVGESAYDVVRGYLVQVPDADFASALRPEKETDLLAQFLLDKL
jgi:hypothetical protein